MRPDEDERQSTHTIDQVAGRESTLKSSMFDNRAEESRVIKEQLRIGTKDLNCTPGRSTVKEETDELTARTVSK
jgi:hypothetical protein